ncbi:MAG TPA: type II secretion system F family protein [Methylomirabilota bacterium]|nr:type II secretion system F family protein [Methylomirabilota bacterium]
MPLLITPVYLQKRGDLYDQLARTLSAGMPIIQVIEMLSRSNSSDIARALTAVHQRLLTGLTISEALRALDGWAPEIDIALIEAGEKSGRLDQCFRMLADYYSQRATMGRQMLNQLLYPAFMLHFAILIFPPQMLSRLVWQGEVGPFLTQKLVVLGLLYGGALVFLIGLQNQRMHFWRNLLETISRMIPILGSARRAIALARLSAALEALVSAGQPMARCWELAAQASGSLFYVRASQPVITSALAGEPPGEALQRNTAFPEMFSNLYRTGEISGDLDGTLRRLNAYYAEEGTRKMQALAQWIPRLIYLLILIGIAYFIISFYMGYFSGISDAMQGF